MIRRKSVMTFTVRPLTYRQHNNVIAEALKACSIQTSKITHLMRRTGAQDAERRNVDADQLSRLAGWRTNVKNACYTTDLPLQTLRALGDWPKGM